MKDIITKFATAANLKPKPIEGAGDGSKLGDNIITVLNSVVGILAVICVVVIVIGGVQYMTSAGDAAKVKKAKDTILYAVIGLVVCALAATIVNFVISGLLKDV